MYASSSVSPPVQLIFRWIYYGGRALRRQWTILALGYSWTASDCRALILGHRRLTGNMLVLYPDIAYRVER